MLRTNYGFYKDTDIIFVDDKGIDLQSSINKNRLQYRVQTNNQNKFLNLRFDTAPKRLNASVDMELEYYDNGTHINKSMEMRIVKLDASTIWLWNSEDALGVIIPRF